VASTIPTTAAAKNGHTNEITWKPVKGVRIASVTAQAGDRYVLVGRNLQVVEEKIFRVNWVLGVLWLVALFQMSIVFWLFIKRQKRVAEPVQEHPQTKPEEHEQKEAH
jgi:hypothetical protein